MGSGAQRSARRVAALVIVRRALGRAAGLGRAGPVRQFETSALIPAIAVLVVMAGYLIRGRPAGQPLY
ncbi:hypothetical protein PV772_13760 [Pseudarthrobacter sp. CC12]|uniref:hypothetical protein n=1 Tax=Pseudarthrobacter sp. CC12 TaxID=3029193 RepID=UPI00326553F4